MVKHEGGCHCGRVRFEATAPAEITVSQCNCSICSKSGYLGLIVPSDRFELVRGQEWLGSYSFNTGTARHLFCKNCGVKSFYVPRSHPDGFNVNARCIDSDTVREMTIRPADGRNWEKRYPSGRGTYSE